jgi:Superfamily II DNA and RNA helicases
MAWHFAPDIPVEPTPVPAQNSNPQQPGGSFYGLGIAPKILETLEKLSFKIPTPIQHKAIPICMEGKDIMGVAQTGTGKTLAFAIPVIQRLAQTKGRCLILLPTRELALQVDETFRKISPVFGIKSTVIIGGASMGLQIQALRKGPRVIIATPGRLVDHMERNTIMLADVNILVLDEADRMLDMGFMPSIERILKVIPRERQTLLFSATIPPEIMKIATTYMKLPISIEVAPSGTTAENIVQELFIVKKESKRNLLEKILAQYHGSVLLFARTRIGAKKITRMIRDMGHKAAEIHSDRTLSQRKEALEGFKNGRYRILVATDIAARGIDVAGIELVINYDLPEESDNYVHRIGRTARAGKEGRAISFATPDQGPDVKNIERLIKTVLPISQHPEVPKEVFDSSAGRSSGFRPKYGRGSGGGSGGGSSYGGGNRKRPSSHGHSYGKGESFSRDRHEGPKKRFNKGGPRAHSSNYSEKREHRPESGATARPHQSAAPRHAQTNERPRPHHERREERPGNAAPVEKREYSSSRDHALRHDTPRQEPRQDHSPKTEQPSRGRFPSSLPFAKFRKPQR